MWTCIFSSNFNLKIDLKYILNAILYTIFFKFPWGSIPHTPNKLTAFANQCLKNMKKSWQAYTYDYIYIISHIIWFSMRIYLVWGYIQNTLMILPIIRAICCWEKNQYYLCCDRRVKKRVRNTITRSFHSSNAI